MSRSNGSSTSGSPLPAHPHAPSRSKTAVPGLGPSGARGKSARLPDERGMPDGPDLVDDNGERRERPLRGALVEQRPRPQSFG